MEDICLKWSNHQSSVMSVLDSYFRRESMVDVTLAADGKFVRVHRLLLSACSTYFEELLKDHTDKQAIIFLKDVTYSNLKHIVDFIYKGEVSVDQEDLGVFLLTARSLKIKGLGSSQAEPTPVSSDVIVLDDNNQEAGPFKKTEKRKSLSKETSQSNGPTNGKTAEPRISTSRQQQPSRSTTAVDPLSTTDSDIKPSNICLTEIPNLNLLSQVLAQEQAVPQTDPLTLPRTNQTVEDESFINVCPPLVETELGTPDQDEEMETCLEDDQNTSNAFSAASFVSGPTITPAGYLSCPRCLKLYKDKKAFQLHVSRCGVLSLFSCVMCDKSYQRKDSLMRHVRSHGTSSNLPKKKQK